MQNTNESLISHQLITESKQATAGRSICVKRQNNHFLSLRHESPGRKVSVAIFKFGERASSRDNFLFGQTHLLSRQKHNARPAFRSPATLMNIPPFHHSVLTLEDAKNTDQGARPAAMRYYANNGGDAIGDYVFVLQCAAHRRSFACFARNQREYITLLGNSVSKPGPAQALSPPAEH